MAHEIRSHLAVLSGYISLLEDGSLGVLPRSARSALRPMRSKTRAIARLVDDMLEDLRFQDGRVHLSMRSIKLGRLLKETADEARPQLLETQRLKVTVPAKDLIASIDPRRVRTIVRNLIDNAIKYSPAGGNLEWHLDRDEARARVSVTDSGIGIEPEDLQRIFGRFERAEDGQRPPSEGIGLGLYIARTLARLHGGDLTVSSQPGEGSRFQFTLPLSNAYG